MTDFALFYACGRSTSPEFIVITKYNVVEIKGHENVLSYYIWQIAGFVGTMWNFT
jgi:hypothetical protein